MYCERCGAELDEDARFCERCGQPAMEAPSPVGEMPGEAPRAAAAEHVPVPAAVPAPVSESQAATTGTPVTRRRRRLAAVAAACGVALIALVIAAGVLVAGMTKGGTDAPGQEGTSETSDSRQKDDAKNEVASPVDADADADADPHGDGQGEEPATEEKPVEEEPVGEAVAPASPQIPDLANDDDRYRLTKFLSNFSEAEMWSGYGEEEARAVMRFHRDEPDLARMARFLFLNNEQNGGTRLECPRPDGQPGGILVPWSSVEYMTNLFFGRTYSRELFEGATDTYLGQGLRIDITAPQGQCGPTVPLSVEDAGEGLIRVRFDTYGQCIYDEALGRSPYARIQSEAIEYGDQVYRVRAEDMRSYLGIDAPSTSGTAVLECSKDGSGWSFHLVSYELDGPCVSRPWLS